ncbi:nuclear polyadenylated RNA-binding protein 3-like [Dendrobium catenatum]|uniref:Uncharacterized protein n=1 Tax=Dendrobium catenatum TaxID=906689 RepID=A0A2I0X3M1_9ASPA|nr:nuclear polyadenylated RNA-binding protein 3-like [Dendrobium catenatum]PKU82502.1 hypothetical protein MA16_Dca005507 [Dendrobium catenatum]
MMRQSSSRNQRYKGGFRFRHFLQICLLLAICIWLVYQVKHSHDKKRAFVERKEVEDQAFSFRFGRKDLPSVKRDELMRETRDVDEDEFQELEMKKEDARDEEGGGDVDDWIDEQDREQRGDENELEIELKNEEENGSLVGEANSVDRLEHVDNLTETEAEHADARGLDEEKPNNMDANLKGSSTNVSVDVSNKIYNSTNNGDLNGFVGNHSNIGLRGNATFHEAGNHSMNGTSSEKSESVFGVSKYENDSNSSPISVEESNPNLLLTNSTTIRLPMVTTISTTNLSESLMENRNLSAIANSPSYKEIIVNETASLMVVSQKQTIQNATIGENHAKSKDLVVEFDHHLKSKINEEQESDDQFATISFNKNEISLSQTTLTEEEREARTDLSTLPEIHNDIRHDYEETEQ